MSRAVARAIARCGGYGGYRWESQMLRHRRRLPITCRVFRLEVVVAPRGCAWVGGVRQRARLARVALTALIVGIGIARTRRIFARRSGLFLHAWRLLPASLGAILTHHTAASIWRHR